MAEFDLNAFLPYQVAVLSTRMSAGFSRHYRKSYGINVAEWRVVAHLSQESAVSVREICRRVDMDKPKVSRAASRLEEAGYVTKRINETDRRLVELSLTKKGRAMIEALAPLAQAYEAEIMDGLGAGSAEFRDQLAQLLNMLAPGGDVNPVESPGDET